MLRVGYILERSGGGSFAHLYAGTGSYGYFLGFNGLQHAATNASDTTGGGYPKECILDC